MIDWMRNKGILFITICLIVACRNQSLSLAEKDLLEYGIPITLMVPDSAEIKSMDWGLQKDISIIGNDWFNLQIFSSKTIDHRMDKALGDLKSIVAEGRYFSKFIQEDSDGFIFEMMIDTIVNFDFRHLKIQGDREYLFQGGMSSTFTEDQVRMLYDIAREAR